MPFSNLLSVSGDGAIDEEEFVIIFSSYKIPEQNARDAFKKLSSVRLLIDSFLFSLRSIKAYKREICTLKCVKPLKGLH